MISCPIVGGRFRGAKQAALTALPVGQRLRLEPEPTNRFDPEAVMVMLDSATIAPESHQALAEALAGFGEDLETFLAEDSHHIGYVPSPTGKIAAMGQQIRQAFGDSSAMTAEGTLGFDFKGMPIFILEGD